MKIKITKTAIIILFLLFNFILVNESFAFRITPTSFEVTLRKGEVTTVTLEIDNDDERAISCQIYPTDYQVGLDGKPIFDAAGENPFSAQKMVTIPEPSIVIPAKSGQKVTARITLPKTVSEREYFAVIMAETQMIRAAPNDQQKVNAQIKINRRLGAILRINVVGPTVIKKAAITELKVEKGTQGIEIVATLTNQCPVHLEVEEAEVVIKDTDQRIKTKFLLRGANKAVRGDKVFIYPQRQRNFSGVLETPLAAGKYWAEVIFNYGYRFHKISRKTDFTIDTKLKNSLREQLVMRIEPGTIKMEMKPGSLRRETVKITNLDINPLMIQTSVKVFTDTPWLSVDPNQLTIRPGGTGKIRIITSLPLNEIAARVGKIFVKPERGKTSSVDIVITEPEKKVTQKGGGK